jgi:RHS repeat-associated protein
MSAIAEKATRGKSCPTSSRVARSEEIVTENPQASYYRARYYNPSLQRFISEDPIRFSGGINFYRYVQDSPSNFIDPMGETIGLGNRLDLPGLGGIDMYERTNAYNAYETALLYLSQSPDASAIIQELQQSPNLYMIYVSDEYKKDQTIGSPNSQAVHWNPHKGGCTFRSRGAESPALLLMHELIHLDLRQRGFDPGEEATTQILDQIAAQLGEAARADYGDSTYSETPWPLPIPSTPLAGRNCGCK